MADLVANQAMDLESSAQYSIPTSRPPAQFMHNDVEHWLDTDHQRLAGTPADKLTNIIGLGALSAQTKPSATILTPAALSTDEQQPPTTPGPAGRPRAP